MALSRYAFTPKIMGRKLLATSDLSYKIFFACERGTVPFTTYVIKEGERLEHISGKRYGSANLWWIIAAASGIGWSLQVPPGTLIRVPSNIAKIYQYLR